jgi:fumarate hydratase class II
MARTQGRELWGGETAKAIDNFPVSGEPIPAPVAHWLGRIKAAAAQVNAELGLLDADKAARIAAAGERIAAGELDDQFPIDVFQTGSGTSSNMNANEVMATLAGEDVHRNDDVNMGQSSNDVFPSAVHLAALDELTNDLLPALTRLAGRVRRPRQVGPDALDGRRPGHPRTGVRGVCGTGASGDRPGRVDARARWADPARRNRGRHRAQHPP